MVSSACTAVAGSLTAGTAPAARCRPTAGTRAADPGERFVPARSPTAEYGLVGRLATVQIGDRRTLLKRAPMPLRRDHGAASRLEQAGQVDLLQGGLPVWPRDGAVQGWQHHLRMRPRRAGLAIQVVYDAAAFRGDCRQRRGELDGRKGSLPAGPASGRP